MMIKVKKRNKNHAEYLGKILFIIILSGFLIRFSIELVRSISWFLKGPSWFTYFNIAISTLIIILSIISIYIVTIGKFNQNIFSAIFGVVLIHEVIVQTIVKDIVSFIATASFLSIYLFFIWWGIKINSKNDKTKPKIPPKK